MTTANAQGTDGFWLFEDVEYNGKTLIALIDTGATSCLINEKHIENIKYKVSNASGLGGDFKTKEVELQIKCNGIKKKVTVYGSNFKHIHSLCKSVKVPPYDMIISSQQLVQFNLSKKLYDTLRNRQ